jgi:hypothetical protein
MKRTLFALAAIISATSFAHAEPTTCVGEATSGRSYAAGTIDSGVGNDCLFVAYSRIGRHIKAVCDIGDPYLGRHGHQCRIEAEVDDKKAITRIVKIEAIGPAPAQPIPTRSLVDEWADAADACGPFPLKHPRNKSCQKGLELEKQLHEMGCHFTGVGHIWWCRH